MMQEPGQSGDRLPARQVGAETPPLGQTIARPLVAPTGILIHSCGQDRSPAKTDPWEHRRGEPRVFALLWTIFLFAATGITMLAVVARGMPGADTMRPAARALMVCIAAGIVIVWPLIRLSQHRDEQPIGGMVHDLIVLLVPVQAVVWPQTMWWLARWPLEIVAALALEFTAWSLVIGGVLVMAYASERPRCAASSRADLLRRSGWMAALVVLALGPGVAAAAGGDAPVRWWWMLSPITGVLELTRDRSWSGISNVIYPGHWRMIGVTAAAAIPLWTAAILLKGDRRKPRKACRGDGQGLD
jgi:hypothetical protein